MNEIKIFEHVSFGKIRIIELKGEIWFVAKDVATALGYENTNKAVGDHCKKSNDFRHNETLPMAKPFKIIPESDVYRLVMRSKLPSAEKFQDWVCEEVLPSIRKNGMYATDITIDKMIANPDFAIQLLQNLKEERSKRVEVEKIVSEQHLVIEQQKPAVDFYEDYVDRKTARSFREAAKILGKKEQYFIDKLIELKLIFRKPAPYGKKGKILPYADSIEKGYFEVKTGNALSSDHAFAQTLITPAGIAYIVQLIEKGKI